MLLARILIFLSALLALCHSSTFGVELTESESQTVRELLLYYDWDELWVEAGLRFHF